jgi:hypothetical protein
MCNGSFPKTVFPYCMNRNVFIECEPLGARPPAMPLDDARQGEVIDANTLQLGVVDCQIKPLDRDLHGKLLYL